MSEDWFQAVELMNGCVWLEGSCADQREVGRWMTDEEVTAFQNLQTRQNAEMRKLLREMAA